MISEKNGELIKATTRFALAYANNYYPGAIAATPIVDKVIDRFVTKPKKILIEELEKADSVPLIDEKSVPMFPMVQRYLEAAKEGEGEENLRIFAEFIVNELKEPSPDPTAFTRASRALEGMSSTDLKILAATYKLMEEGPSVRNAATDAEGMPLAISRDVAEASVLAHELKNFAIEHQNIMEALADFANRGLIYATPNNDFNRPDPYAYLQTQLGREIMRKARRSLSEAAPGVKA